jgi:4-amino-4-deoxy-L-arabinose transferase-like glycosyltransferase
MRARLRGDVVWLIVIAGGFAVASYATLGLQSFDSGETITAGKVIHSSYLATFHAFATGERSGPVYYSLAWAWSRVFGVGEVGLRSLSLIATLGTIVAMYLAGRELAGRRAGVLAALLTACNPDVYWFSQEARSYPFYICLSAVGAYFFLRSLRRPSRLAYGGWALAACVGLATHYFTAFFFGIEAAVLIWVAWRRDRRAPVVAAAAWVLTGLALLPLAISQEHSGRANAFTSVPVLERGASALVKFATGQMTHPSGALGDTPMAARMAAPVILSIFAVAIVVLFRRTPPEPRRLARWVALVAGLGFAIPLALALGGLDYVEPYNLDGALPLLLLLVAAGADAAIAGARIPRRLRFAPAAALALPMAGMVGAICLSSALQRDNWRGLSQAVLATRPSGIVLADPPQIGVTLSYYLGPDLPGLDSSASPCGVEARRIVAVSEGPQNPPRSGFRLTATHIVDGRWTVATYEAPRPVALDTKHVEDLGIVRGRHSTLVDGARPLPAPQPETVAVKRLQRLATASTTIHQPAQTLACGLEAGVNLQRL